MKIIDGKAIAKSITENLKTTISNLAKKPGLAVIIVGQDPASKLYVKKKYEKCKELNIHSQLHRLSETVTQKELLSLINRLNLDDNIHAIIVQLPLPKHIDAKIITLSIAQKKDVDGFHPMNVGNLVNNIHGIIPCTPKGILKLIESTKIDIQGKHAVIIGRSNIVGKPIAQLLLSKNATVTICHSKTENLPEIIMTADILVAAVGKPKLVKNIKPGALVIDVGMSRIENKLVGDVDFDNIKDKASFITPVPGGVGPMTIAMLMENILECYNES